MAGREFGWGAPLFFLLVSVGAGGLCAYWTRDYTGLYDSLIAPPLSLPFAAFPVAESVLWAMTGASAGIVMGSRCHPDAKSDAIKLYFSHLVLSMAVPVLFLRFEFLTLSFTLAALLWTILAAMTSAFARVQRVAGFLLLPRLVWSVYLLYILLGICVLN